jgi:hypothetical protein
MDWPLVVFKLKNTRCWPWVSMLAHVCGNQGIMFVRRTRYSKAVIPSTLAALLALALIQTWVHHTELYLTRSRAGRDRTGLALPGDPSQTEASAAPRPWAANISAAITEARGNGTTKVFKFYNVGRAYHHLPACPQDWPRPGVQCDSVPCPTTWEWTTNKHEADAGEA